MSPNTHHTDHPDEHQDDDNRLRDGAESGDGAGVDWLDGDTHEFPATAVEQYTPAGRNFVRVDAEYGQMMRARQDAGEAVPDYDQWCWTRENDVDQENLLAASAAEAGAIADAVAAYGHASEGWAETAAQWAAADAARAGLDPVLAAHVAAHEATRNRPITLAELSWLDHWHTTRPATANHDDSNDDATDDASDTSGDWDGLW